MVRTPDGTIEIDESGRRAGRGAYLCRDGDCRTIAIERGALTRALASPVPAELRSALADGMTTRNEGGARGQE
ncbi:MAG: YlxR family protein [Chloroflexota bacterium]|nr:YlxR family protein [Chloroflexota bacterium]